jgi:CubicO group peptidase (beta-lactamase class C family)
MVIAKASGEPYQTFITQRLLRPLQLKSAGFCSHKLVYADAARGYTAFALGTLRPAESMDCTWFAGTGDLVMSAVDLARWDIALDSGKIVTLASFTAMSTPKRLPNGKSTFYGYGLGAGTKFLGRPMVGHLGRVSGFISEDFTIPPDELAVVILGNGDNFNPVPIGHRIVASLYGRKPPAHDPPALAQTPAEAAQARQWLARAFKMPGVAALAKREGPPLEMKLISRDGPTGERAYAYRVTFAREVLEFDYVLTAYGKLDFLSFSPWYDY